MNKKEYLNEEEYQKNSKKLKNTGKILLIIGIITLVLGMILLFSGFNGFGKTATSGMGFFDTNIEDMASNAFGSMGLFALGGFLNTIGFAITAAGGITMFIAHRREITAFTMQQTMPLAQEGIEKMTPTISNAVGDIAQSITKGIKEGLSNDEEK